MAEITNEQMEQMLKALAKPKYDFDCVEKVLKAALNAYKSGFYLGEKQGLRNAIEVAKRYKGIDMTNYIGELEEMLNE